MPCAELPTGRSLARHIENLRTGKTPLDSIERELLPYGGAMSESIATTPIDASGWRELESVIAEFTPDQEGLARLEESPVIKKIWSRMDCGYTFGTGGEYAVAAKVGCGCPNLSRIYLMEFRNRDFKHPYFRPCSCTVAG